MSAWVTIKEGHQLNFNGSDNSTNESFIFDLRTSYNRALNSSGLIIQRCDEHWLLAISEYEKIIKSCVEFLANSVCASTGATDEVKLFQFLALSNLSRIFLKSGDSCGAMMCAIDAMAVAAISSDFIRLYDQGLISRIAKLNLDMGEFWVAQQLLDTDIIETAFRAMRKQLIQKSLDVSKNADHVSVFTSSMARSPVTVSANSPIAFLAGMIGLLSANKDAANFSDIILSEIEAEMDIIESAAPLLPPQCLPPSEKPNALPEESNPVIVVIDTEASGDMPATKALRRKKHRDAEPEAAFGISRIAELKDIFHLDFDDYEEGFSATVSSQPALPNLPPPSQHRDQFEKVSKSPAEQTVYSVSRGSRNAVDSTDETFRTQLAALGARIHGQCAVSGASTAQVHILFLAMAASFVSASVECSLLGGAIDATENAIAGTAIIDLTDLSKAVMKSWVYVVSTFGGGAAAYDELIPRLSDDEILILAESAFDILYSEKSVFTTSAERMSSGLDSPIKTVAERTLAMALPLLPSFGTVATAETTALDPLQLQSRKLRALRAAWLSVGVLVRTRTGTGIGDTTDDDIRMSVANSIACVKVELEFFPSPCSLVLAHRGHDWRVLSAGSLRRLQSQVNYRAKIHELESGYRCEEGWLEHASSVMPSYDAFVDILIICADRPSRIEASLIGLILKTSSMLGSRASPVCWLKFVGFVAAAGLETIDDQSMFCDESAVCDSITDLLRMVTTDLPGTSDVSEGFDVTELDALVCDLLQKAHSRRKPKLFQLVCDFVAVATEKWQERHPLRAALTNVFGLLYERLSLVVVADSSILEDDVWHLSSVVSAVIVHCHQLFSRITTFRQRSELAGVIIAVFGSETQSSRQAKLALLLLPLFEHVFTVPAERSSATQIFEAFSTLHDCCCEEGFYTEGDYSIGKFVASSLNTWLVRASAERFSVPSSSLTMRMKKDLLIGLGEIYSIIFRLPMASLSAEQSTLHLCLAASAISDQDLRDLYAYTLCCEPLLNKSDVRASLLFLYDLPCIKLPRRTRAIKLIEGCLFQADTSYELSADLLQLFDAGLEGETPGPDSIEGEVLTSVYHSVLRLGAASALALAGSSASTSAGPDASDGAHSERRIVKAVHLCLQDLSFTPTRFETWARLQQALGEWLNQLCDQIGDLIVPECLPEVAYTLKDVRSFHSYITTGGIVELQMFSGGDSDDWSKHFGSMKDFCVTLEAAGVKRTSGSSAASDEASVTQAQRVAGLIYLKNTVSFVLDNATSLISRVAQGRLRPVDTTTSSPPEEHALRTAYADMMELKGVIAYNLAQENAKGSSLRKNHLRSSLECFRNALSVARTNAFVSFMVGKLTMTLYGDLGESLKHLSEAAATADEDAKTLKVAIQYTASSIRAKQSLKLLTSLCGPPPDPSEPIPVPMLHPDPDAAQSIEDTLIRSDCLLPDGSLDLIEQHSFRPRCLLTGAPIGNSDGPQAELISMERVFEMLSDALDGLCDCRKQDQYHPHSVYRVSFILNGISDLLFSGRLLTLPTAFTSKLATLGLVTSHEYAWTESDKLFDKKRSQVVALWCVETASDGYELILQRTYKFDGLRRKFLRHHLQLAVRLGKLSSVLALCQWTLSGKAPSPSATTEWMCDQLVHAAIQIMASQLAHLQTTPSDDRASRDAFDSLKAAYDLHTLGRRRLVARRILDLERLIGTFYVVAGYANIENPPDTAAVLMNCSELWPSAKAVAGTKRPRAQPASSAVPPSIPVPVITTTDATALATDSTDDVGEPSEKEAKRDDVIQQDCDNVE